MTAVDLSQMLTIAQVAQRLNLSYAITRLHDRELEPVLVPRGTKQFTRYYHPDVVERVAEAMRARRGGGRNNNWNKPVNPEVDRLAPVWRHLWRSHCTGAASRALVNDVTIDDFIETCRSVCVYCGTAPLPREVGSSYTVEANGLDRVDNTKGYTIDNIVSCCGTCNYMKSDLTFEQFHEHIRKIAKHLANFR